MYDEDSPKEDMSVWIECALHAIDAKNFDKMECFLFHMDEQNNIRERRSDDTLKLLLAKNHTVSQAVKSLKK